MASAMATRLTLDVVMDDFWTRPTGMFGKPIWVRPGVLQLIFDDDNNKLQTFAGPSVPGGHSAFTRTASIYSTEPITDADMLITSSDGQTELMRNSVTAYTQRVHNCYIVEANILGFATGETGIEEQVVLSNALRWALADYVTRFGDPPDQIVLHLDVNGTLMLGDVASKKSMAKSANNLARDVLKREEDSDSFKLTDEVREAVTRAKDADEESVKREYTAAYSANDFIRAVMLAMGALAPATILKLNEEMSANAAQMLSSKNVRESLAKARSSDSLETPSCTVAIRTNGVEHRQAAVYVQRLVMGVLGIELSEEIADC